MYIFCPVLDESMTLRLSIENVERLPDGRPLQIEVNGRGLDLGRDAHLDWTLPDGSRIVSGKHCEIRFKEGGYWLCDVSTNGTFLNGSLHRLDAPYLLQNGDRLNIGPYIIAVSVQGGPDPDRIQALASSPPISKRETLEQAAPPRDRAAGQSHESSTGLPQFADSDPFFDPAKAPRPQPATQRPDSWLMEPVRLPGEAVSASRHPSPFLSTPSPAPIARTAASEPRATAIDAALLSRIARAAGMPENALASRDPNALADEIGSFIRLTAQNLAQMLASRADSKTLMRSSTRTMVRGIENNPLKFANSVEEALAIMFGAPMRQYLSAQATIENTFSDLKTHQVLIYAAMRDALDVLFEDLAPERIDRSVEEDHGLGRLVVSRKAKLWDIYVERWRATTKRADGRLLEAFMALFAEAYDRLQEKGR
jgi:type VI secretion system protein ImpI